MSRYKPVLILMAEDDPDDRILIRDAFEEIALANPIRFVGDGEELLDYLRRKGDYTDTVLHPLPGLILLDLNMPRKDGREALREIKQDDALRHIPIIVLTTSKAEEDISHTYSLGVNSFIVKPVGFEALVRLVSQFSRYWLETVVLPGKDAFK